MNPESTVTKPSRFPADLATKQATMPVCLTNRECENAWGSPELFALIGLPQGEFYPLTDNEKRFIREDKAEGGTAWAYMGYSVVYKSKKWLSPLMEFRFPNESLATVEKGMYDNADFAFSAASAIKDTLDPVFTTFGGEIFLIENESDDRHVMMFMVPFEYAMTFGNYDGWKNQFVQLLAESADPDDDQEAGPAIPMRSTLPADLAIEQATEPIFLTSGCCENAWGTPELFQILGLEAGEFDGEFYPLTMDESQFIGEDMIEGGKAWAYTGYSALYKGKKWLMPCMEFSFPEETGAIVEEGLYESDVIAKQEALAIKDALNPIFSDFGGEIMFKEFDTDDRHTLMFLIPFEYAMKFGNYEGWKKQLVNIFSLSGELDDEKAIWAFHWTAKARYAETAGYKEEIMFGRFCVGGGGNGELAMRWRKVGNQLVPRLEAYGHEMTLLLDLMPLLKAIKTLPPNFTQQEFVNVLLTEGFRDLTAY